MRQRRRLTEAEEIDFFILLPCLILALLLLISEFGPRLGPVLRPREAAPPPPPSLATLASLVAARVPHTPDGPGDDYWQRPEETLSRGTGDCEDRALLLLALASSELGRRDGVVELVTYSGLPPGTLHAEAVFGREAFLPPVGANPATRRVWARIPAEAALALAGTRPTAADLVAGYSVR